MNENEPPPSKSETPSKIEFSAPNRKIAFVHDSRADFRHAGPKRHCGNLLEGHRGLRMQVGPAQSRQSKISEFSARTKPAGFENRRRVHTRKYRPPRAFGLILALSIVKKRRAGRSRRRHRRPVSS